MKALLFFISMLLVPTISVGQNMETVFLDPKDSTSNTYVAIFPQSGRIESFMILLGGFGNNDPKDILIQTELPKYAATQDILTVIPILETGATYFGSDSASQQSLKKIIDKVVEKYKLEDKGFYIGGFSIGGTCAVKYAELAVENNYTIRPKAVFAVASPLDWERYYNAAKRVVRLSAPSNVNSEVTYMIGRIEKEMHGTPQTAIGNFYKNSPYSYSDSTQKAVRNLIETPIMLIAEPDIQWWLSERGYDYTYLNDIDQAAMINELQRLGNKNAVLVTTTNKGYRNPNNLRHPHSWSIADPVMLINWLVSQQ